MAPEEQEQPGESAPEPPYKPCAHLRALDGALIGDRWFSPLGEWRETRQCPDCGREVKLQEEDAYRPNLGNAEVR